MAGPPDNNDWAEQFAAIPVPTLGGKQLWGDVFLYAGWRIQRHALTGQHRLLDPRDVRHALGDWGQCHDDFVRIRARRGLSLQSDHLVLCLHGYFRSKDSMGAMVRALSKAGYEAHGVNYPSTRQGLQDHADQVELLLNRAQGVRQVSFVTHSMGGIVTRVLLGREQASWRQRLTPHRLVMIGTPNKGAHMAAHIQSLPKAGAIVGPSMRQITPEQAADIPMPTIPVGTIAGIRGDGRGFNPLLPGEDDMTVSLESAHLDGAEDQLTVPYGLHTVMMMQPTIIEATKRYLRTGRFTA